MVGAYTLYMLSVDPVTEQNSQIYAALTHKGQARVHRL